MLSPRFAVRMFLVGVTLLGASVVSAQDYPNKSIRVVTGTAGSGSDFTARLVAQGISGFLGQPVIVENRTGVLAAEVVSKAQPDGYTLTVNGENVWIGPLLRKVPFDALRDFSPISLLGRFVNVLVVHPSVAATSVKELIALAKAKPGELNYASSATGGPAHLGLELFKSMAGVNIVHVTYKGGGPALNALLTGEVQLTFIDAGIVLPHVKSGRLRALAIASAEPSALAPGLPTVSASGLPGYELVGRTVIFAPAKTRQAIIRRLNQEIVRALNGTEVKEKFFNAGIEIVASSPEQFAATIKSDIARWSKVIKDAGIKID